MDDNIKTRLLKLQKHIEVSQDLTRNNDDIQHIRIQHHMVSSNTISLQIGSLTKTLTPPKTPFKLSYPEAFLPPGFLSSQEIRSHLLWLMQKDLLKQDVFLIGPPGPFRRWIALSWVYLTQQEMEYVQITRDTAESELKQRREIKNKSVVWHDQAPVRAAIEGRVLIIDGLEKAERNVLPILNNLLEAREMNLEDGRFLISPERYDHLLKTQTKQQLDEKKLVRVHENFRVIALGLPVPKFLGNALDPPLRSRFQARNISPLSPESQLELFTFQNENDNPFITNSLRKLLSIHISLITFEQSGKDLLPNLPWFPTNALLKCSKLLSKNQDLNLWDLLMRSYPFDLSLENDKIEIILNIFKEKGLTPNGSEFRTSHENILKQMEQDYNCQFDICILGKRGCGKTLLSKKFLSQSQNFGFQTIYLYKDMTIRDLLQRRATKENGDTFWEYSPLISCAISGKVAILDGIDRLHRGTICSLQRILHDREIELFDGTVLLHHESYERLLKNSKKTKRDLERMKIFPIHPKFFVIAIGENPTPKNQWLTSEVMTLFQFHCLPNMSTKQKSILLQTLFPNSLIINSLLNLDEEITKFLIKQRSENSKENEVLELSLRQLIKITRHCSKYPKDLYDMIQRTLLVKFLAQSTRDILEELLKKVGILSKTKNILEEEEKIKIQRTTTSLKIGDIESRIFKVKNPALVPRTLFYHSRQQDLLLQQMLKSFTLKEHLLLIGNQGVGKNKLIDRLLELLSLEREYIQLHRDTTVQSLTLSPSIHHGQITWEDSPLVKSVQNGRVLIIDESDKAPLEVTSVLKGLVEDGEMLLADGRRIVRDFGNVNGNVIKMHENFRIVCLANRPGFPFLGNDFFAQVGDCFSCIIVDNPDPESELQLLKQYSPNVPDHLLQALTSLFRDLRQLVEKGLLNYPYSLRELVNLVKHLEKFGSDGLITTLENVFSFDAYNPQLREHLVSTLNKYGIPFDSGNSFAIQLSSENPLLSQFKTNSWKFNLNNNNNNYNSQIPLYKTSLETKASWKLLKGNPLEIRGKTIGRLEKFDETVLQFNIESEGHPLSVASLKDGSLHILFNDPFQVHHYDENLQFYEVIGLGGFLPLYTSDFMSAYTTGLSHIGTPSIHPFGNHSLVIYIPLYKMIMILNLKERELSVHQIGDFSGVGFTVFKNQVFLPRGKNQLHLTTQRPQIVNSLIEEGFLTFYQPGDEIISILDLNIRETTTIKTGLKLNYVFAIEPQFLILFDENNQAFSLYFDQKANIYPISSEKTNLYEGIWRLGPKKIGNLVFSSPDAYASFSKRTPDGLDIYSYPRFGTSTSKTDITHTGIFLPKSQQLLNIPRSEDIDQSSQHTVEIIDFKTGNLRLIPISTIASTSRNQRLQKLKAIISACEMPNSDVCLLHGDATINIIQIDVEKTQESIKKWKSIIGKTEKQELDLRINGLESQPQVKDPNRPKYGEEDDDEHHGGNNFAGGTGGFDTAGLGGANGPFRKGSKHPVHQIKEAEKKKISEEMKREAREMAQKALAKKLREIEMSDYDSQLYERYYKQVSREITTLRTILESVEAKEKDRVWLSHKTSGDIDDKKLIESITGEKNIYKKRGEAPPELGAPQEKPKILLFCMDISGSMYRFNGQDQRLERLLMSTLMIMEALQGFEHKYLYSIIGHSGDGPAFPLVDFTKQPTNRNERLKVLQKMSAHSEYCQSGDSTVESIEWAVKTIVNEPADDYFVFCVSDANIERYGIKPSHLSKVLTNPKVHAHVIFIASFQDEAVRMKKELPQGKAYVCLQPSQLPLTLKSIFDQSVLKNSNL